MAATSKIYLPDAKLVWVPADILSADGATLKVQKYVPDPTQKLDDAAPTKSEDVTLTEPFASVETLPLRNEGLPAEGASDMVSLDYLHEASVLYNLRKRYFASLPYTYTGTMCIAVNPYKWLDLYSETNRLQYAKKKRNELPPHVYAISAMAYDGVAARSVGGQAAGIDQSILVSGESGAGKTETVKIMMGYLASVASGGQSDVVQRVLESQPLLESFGNAKTIRNDNSSRFGKFTQLEFDATARVGGGDPPLVGSRCRTYLLEKSRITGQAPGERAYHCFYGVARGRSPSRLNLKAQRFTKTGDLATQTIEGVLDKDRFAKTWDALRLVGVDEAERKSVADLLEVTLLLGDVDVEETSTGEGEGSSLIQDEASSKASHALGVDAQHLEKALTERTVKARNETFKVPLTAQQARDARDALAKDIYMRTFDWIVGKINTATSSGDVDRAMRVVGLLDIFGFESFAVNRFEQLCINYTNEKLQQKFTLDLFKTVQQEYDDEGVPWQHVAFPDNVAVLQLIEGRMGIIDVLNEECVRPRGSDEGFVNKMTTLHAVESTQYTPHKMNKDQFTISHYAGQVTYTAHHWLARNTDALPEDLAEVARCSSFGMLSTLFADKGVVKKKGKLVKDTVCTKFKAELTLLMEEIERTQVQYVRCVKPNSLKSSAHYDVEMVVDQLRCAGVIEAIRVARAGYPNKLPHAEIPRRFGLLCGTGSTLQLCKQLVGEEPATAQRDGPYAVGASRVYFKAGVLEALERRRADALGARAIVVQARWRQIRHTRRYAAARKGAILMQARRRRDALRRIYLRRKAAAIIAQSARRAVVAKKRVMKLRSNKAAARIAATWRGRYQRRSYENSRKSAIKIQTSVRARHAVALHEKRVSEAREQAKLENRLAAMEAKLRDAQAKKGEEDGALVANALTELRSDNALLRKDNEKLKSENAQLKKKVSDLEQEKVLQADVLAASRAAHVAPKAEIKKQAASPRAAKTPQKEKQSRFAALVGSLGFGHTPTERDVPPTPASGRRDRRAPHIARPLNRFWQDVPAGSLVSALPTQAGDVARVHLKVGGQYLCATGARGCALEPLPQLKSPSANPSDGRDACYLRCEPPVQVSAQVARANGQTGANGGDFGYRTAMAFVVETAAEGSFRLRSELTGGYVCVGGLFQRYCLCASAPTAAEATAFEFVARQLNGNEEPVGEPDPSSPGGRDASMERLRAQQLLVALRASDGPKRGHFVRVRPDAYVNVAPPASPDAARGALPADDRTTPLLSVELLVPLGSYEVTFVASQLGLIVSKTMPLKVVRFKDVGVSLAPAAELSGRIAVGDVLASADGRDITQCSRREAVDQITSTRPITIGFRVGGAVPGDV